MKTPSKIGLPMPLPARRRVYVSVHHSTGVFRIFTFLPTKICLPIIYGRRTLCVYDKSILPGTCSRCEVFGFLFSLFAVWLWRTHIRWTHYHSWLRAGISSRTISRWRHVYFFRHIPSNHFRQQAHNWHSYVTSAFMPTIWRQMLTCTAWRQ